jgi:hypothetical protein
MSDIMGYAFLQFSKNGMSALKWGFASGDKASLLSAYLSLDLKSGPIVVRYVSLSQYQKALGSLNQAHALARLVLPDCAVIPDPA